MSKWGGVLIIETSIDTFFSNLWGKGKKSNGVRDNGVQDAIDTQRTISGHCDALRRK